MGLLFEGLYVTGTRTAQRQARYHRSLADFADRACPSTPTSIMTFITSKNQSFLLDLIIIGKTLLVPLFGLGAR
jgi:hypothetical protein